MRKFLSFVLPVALPAVLLMSCSSDEPEIKQYNNSTEVLTHKVSLQDALDRSKVFWDGMTSDKPSTRSRNFADIESVEYISSSSSTRTRSGAADTIFYLVNYKNEKGFMLLSADDRMLPVYAMSDEGRLDLNDTIFNEGLRMFYNNAKSDALRLPPYKPDTTTQIVVDPFDYTYDRTVKPKLSKNLRFVHQYSPFNKYCFTKSGEQALVGCLPLAAAEILAYFNAPSIISNRKLDWNSINANVQCDDFYFLLSQLGTKEYLNATYGVTSTSARKDSVPSVFAKLGFNHLSEELFNDRKAALAIENNPILIYGVTPGGGAHMWVMDGYIRYGTSHNIMSGPEPGRIPPYFFFHCCWGWRGLNNGYYYYSANGYIDGYPNMYDDEEPYWEEQTRYLNYYRIKMFVNFKK